MIVIIHLQRGIPSKRKSSTCIDYVPQHTERGPEWTRIHTAVPLVDRHSSDESATITHCKDTLMARAHGSRDATMSNLQLHLAQRNGVQRLHVVGSCPHDLRHSPLAHQLTVCIPEWPFVLFAKDSSYSATSQRTQYAGNIFELRGTSNAATYHIQAQLSQ